MFSCDLSFRVLQSDEGAACKLHVLYGLDAVGPVLRAAVSETYYSVIGMFQLLPVSEPDRDFGLAAALGNVMSKEHLFHASRLLLLDLCNIEASSADLDLMTKVGAATG